MRNVNESVEGVNNRFTITVKERKDDSNRRRDPLALSQSVNNFHARMEQIGGRDGRCSSYGRRCQKSCNS